MTDAQIHAHYKRISHIEDLMFHARTNDRTSSPELLAEWHRAVLEPRPAAENRKQLARLLQRWREERAENERIAGIPALGSPRWFEQIKAEESEELINAS